MAKGEQRSTKEKKKPKQTKAKDEAKPSPFAPKNSGSAKTK